MALSLRKIKGRLRVPPCLNELGVAKSGRVFRGPELVDSMMASLLLGTGGTALLLAFFKITKEAYYINLALGFALLAGVVGVAFAIIILGKSKDGI